MVDVPSMDTPLLRSKHKAIATLFPYATRLEQDGQPEMFDVISHASRTAGLILQWRHIRTHITALFDKSSPPSLNRAIALMPPCPPDFFGLDAKNRVLRWAIAASAVQYSEEVCQSVVNMLLQISNDDSNRSYIPVEIWTWLKKRPSLPPTWLGQSNIFRFTVVHHVRGLGDIEILKSFLLLVWSEWSMSNTTPEVEVIIQEDFGGIGVWGHRDDLIKHLNHVQGQLDRGLEYFKQHNPQIEGWRIRARKSDYGYLKDVLLEVDKRTMETLTRTPPRVILFHICVLILVGAFRIPHNLRLCSATPVSMISRGRCHFQVRRPIVLQRSLHGLVFCLGPITRFAEFPRPLSSFSNYRAVWFGRAQDYRRSFYSTPAGVSEPRSFFWLNNLGSSL